MVTRSRGCCGGSGSAGSHRYVAGHNACASRSSEPSFHLDDALPLRLKSIGEKTDQDQRDADRSQGMPAAMKMGRCCASATRQSRIK